MKVLLFIFSLFYLCGLSVYAVTSRGVSEERGMTPMGYRWHECTMGGTVIECKVEDCESMCADIAKKEKEEKESQREERIQDIIIDSQQQGDDKDKNPAIFQVP